MSGVILAMSGYPAEVRVCVCVCVHGWLLVVCQTVCSLAVSDVGNTQGS